MEAVGSLLRRASVSAAGVRIVEYGVELAGAPESYLTAALVTVFDARHFYTPALPVAVR